MRFVLAAALVVMLGSTGGRPARAGRCLEPLAWKATTGSVSAGATCGATVLTAEAAGAGSSSGRAHLVGDVEGDVVWTVTVQRLSADEGSLQLQFPGGWLMLRDGEVGLYQSEAQWTMSGWQVLSGELADYRLVDPVTVRLELRGDRVIAALDGVTVGRWTVPLRSPKGSLGVWVLGPRGVRSRALLRDPSMELSSP